MDKGEAYGALFVFDQLLGIDILQGGTVTVLVIVPSGESTMLYWKVPNP